MADKRGKDYNKRLTLDEVKDKLSKDKKTQMCLIAQQLLLGIQTKCKIYYKI